MWGMRILKPLPLRRTTIDRIINWGMVTIAVLIGLSILKLGYARYNVIVHRQSCISRPPETLPAKVFRVLFVPDKIDRDRGRAKAFAERAEKLEREGGKPK